MTPFEAAKSRILAAPRVLPHDFVASTAITVWLPVPGLDARLVAEIDDLGSVLVYAASSYEEAYPDAVVLRAVLAPDAFVALVRTLMAQARGRLIRRARDRRRGICRVGVLRVHTGRRRRHPYWLSVVDLRQAGACRPMLTRLAMQVDWAPGIRVTDDMALLYGAANPHGVATTGARWLMEGSDLVTKAAYDEVILGIDLAEYEGDDQRAVQLAAAAYRRTRRDARRGRRAGWCHR